VIKVTYVHADGRRETCQTVAGETVLDCALDHGVAGIKGQCGGACTCVTCHCYVDASWVGAVPAALADELEMLDYAPARQPNSRLSCQITIISALDGLLIHIPRAD